MNSLCNILQRCPLCKISIRHTLSVTRCVQSHTVVKIKTKMHSSVSLVVHFLHWSTIVCVFQVFIKDWKVLEEQDLDTNLFFNGELLHLIIQLHSVIYK